MMDLLPTEVVFFYICLKNIQRMKFTPLISLIIVSVLLFIGCNKKDADTNNPTIQIISPKDGKVCSAGDTIWIKASVSDDVKLESVDIQLVTSGGRAAGKSLLIKPDISHFGLDTIYIIDEYIESGDYFLRFEVFDGTNTQREFVATSVKASTIVEERIIVLTEEPGKIVVNQLVEGELIREVLIDGDYADARINSYSDQLYVAGQHTLDFSAFSLNDSIGDPLWEGVSSQLKPFHDPDCMCLGGNEVFVASSDGYIRSYNVHGITMFDVEIEDARRPAQIHATEDVVIVESIQNGTQEHYIDLFYRYSNGFMLNFKNHFDIVDMYTIDASNWLMIGNKTNDIFIGTGAMMESGVTALETIYGEQVVCSASFGDQIAIFTGEKIYLYEQSSNSVSLLNDNVQCDHILANYETNELYAYSKNEISIYSFPGGQLKNTFNFAENIIDVLIDYNK